MNPRSKSVSRVNILQIGVGFHARRIYVPAILRLAERFPVLLCAAVDTMAQKPVLDAYIKTLSTNLEMVYLSPTDDHSLSAEAKASLDSLVKRLDINAVIISTDPTTHFMYAQWALEQGLHILMDKPISTRAFVSSSIKEAEGLVEDYDDLLKTYSQLQLRKETIFSINVQRRYEIGFRKVFELIREVGERFNAPVTSIQSMHSDGVWIFPDEIVDQTSHPYRTGYGKCSHSGYHIFDIIWQFYLASGLKDKRADAGEVMTSFLGARGLLKQFNIADYESYFPGYSNLPHRSEAELAELFENYGEIDAFSLIRLLKDNETICNISSNLIHNGFSRRSWEVSNPDLYKGNGRVKHQSYTIQQGPFQNIQIHQYQSEANHDTNAKKDYLLGGNNHFEIYVFRNAGMFGAGEPSFMQYNLRDLGSGRELDDSRLYNETVKDTVIIEFIQYILGGIPKSALRSNIDSHSVGVSILSAVYRSQSQQIAGLTPLAPFLINEAYRGK